jgi:hypothetical protein
MQDVRYAVRVLWKTKAWTTMVVLSLALGIGANTALFTAVNGLLLRKLEVAQPDSLVRFHNIGQNDMVTSSIDYGNVTTEDGQPTRASFSYAILLGRLLLVVQVAISLVLLVGAGLFLRTVENLRRVDVGFNPQNLVLFRVNPQLNGYDPQRIGALYDRLAERLEAIPGVRAVTLSNPPLMTGSVNGTSIVVQGRAFSRDDINRVRVAPNFFEAMRFRCLPDGGSAIATARRPRELPSSTKLRSASSFRTRVRWAEGSDRLPKTAASSRSSGSFATRNTTASASRRRRRCMCPIRRAH